MKKRDYERVLDDLKISSKMIKIIRDENNPENKKYACELAKDMLDRVFRDVKEIYEEDHKPGDNSSYSGNLEV